MSNMKRVLILRGNAMVSDPRVEKVIEILGDQYHLSIQAFDRTASHPKEDKLRGVNVRRFYGLTFLKGSKLKGINALFYQVYLFWIALTSSYDIIHACDFKTYAPAVIGVKLRGKRIVYDIFDFFFDMVFSLPKTLKRGFIELDLITMRIADVVILADDTRKKQVQAHRLNKLIVFYNSPDDLYQKTQPYQDYQPTDKNKLNLVYVGLVDNRKRDFQFAMDAISKRAQTSLDIYGAGYDYKNMKQKYQYAENIRFMGKVPYTEILNVEASYDAVFAAYDPSIPNNVLASPNKLFEAMMLAKPIIINEELVAADLVKEQNIGFTYPYKNESAFSSLLDQLINDKDILAQKGRNGRNLYLSRFGFEQQRKTLTEAYASL